MSNPALRVHPKFLCLCGILKISQALARGLLECLWDAVSHSGDPDIGNVTAIETAAGWTGEPGQLCAALLECGCGRAGFIEEIPGKPGLYRLHDLLDHSPADLRRKWIRQHERKERGTTISDIRRAAANARWAKKHAGDATVDANADANADAKPCKPMQMDGVCMPLQTCAEPVGQAVPDKTCVKQSQTDETNHRPPATDHQPPPTHYIPSFAEAQNFISAAGLRGDARDFISEYRSMKPQEADWPDRWRVHLHKWAKQELAQWKRAAREQRKELIATAPARK